AVGPAEGVSSPMVSGHAQSGQRQGTTPDFVTFFRFGEISVLFERVDKDPYQEELDETTLGRAFATAQVQVTKEPFQRAGNPQDRRQQILLEGQGKDGVDLLFQTVNLQSWRPNLDQQFIQRGRTDDTDAAVREVVGAVNALNGAVRG